MSELQARHGAEIAEFVDRYRDGYPLKVAAIDVAMMHRAYQIAPGDGATDENWTGAGSTAFAEAVERAERDREAVDAIPGPTFAPEYNGRGTEPHDGRAMTVRDDEPVRVEPRDPLRIREIGDTNVARCAICPTTPDLENALADGSAVIADSPGAARSALSGHLRREHDRSPWPGQ